MDDPRSGAEIVENGEHCVNCGAPRSSSPQPPESQTPPALPSATGQIVFAVVNIVLCGGSVFGIVALVFAILATTARAVEEALRYLRVAKVLNLVGICLIALGILFSLVVLFLSVLVPLAVLFPFLAFPLGAVD